MEHKKIGRLSKIKFSMTKPKISKKMRIERRIFTHKTNPSKIKKSMKVSIDFKITRIMLQPDLIAI
jgi:hypothetical protein